MPSDIAYLWKYLFDSSDWNDEFFKEESNNDDNVLLNYSRDITIIDDRFDKFCKILNENMWELDSSSNSICSHLPTDKYVLNVTPHLDNYSHSNNSSNITQISNDCENIFDKLKNIEEKQLLKILTNESVIFESHTKLYSSTNGEYIEAAALLTKSHLYFISATNYGIWEKFRDRSKINELINENTAIDEQIATQLVKNLDLTDDELINNSVIRPYLIGKTKKEVKFGIILTANESVALSSIFGIKQDNELKNINTIVINNTNVIQQAKLQQFIDYLLDDIGWFDKYEQNGATIIKLQQYHSNSLVKSLNDRKRKYLEMKTICSQDELSVSVHQQHSTAEANTSLRFVDVAAFKRVEPLDIYEAGYAFELLNDCGQIITVQLQSNNLRHSWITHLDYQLYTNGPSLQVDKNQIETMTTNIQDVVEEKECLNVYSFGVDLNYWEPGFANSVIPKYKTLRNELLKNKISKMHTKDYYSLYKICLELLKVKGYKVKAKNIGINNRKFNIPVGSQISINHLISMKVYTDFTLMQREFSKTFRKQENESMSDLVNRNAEIAHWSRNLNECARFYGTPIKTKDVFYTGLNKKFLFNAFTAHFNLPTSTTTCVNQAQKFADNDGTVIALKVANPNASYFDVSWISNYKQEQEKLFYGSELKIVNIYVNQNVDARLYISAIQLFEQIVNGWFIEIKTTTEETLYELISCILKLDGNNMAIPEYIKALFEHFMCNTISTKSLWLSGTDLEKIKHQKLRSLLYETSAFFDCVGVKSSNINWTEQFRFDIAGDTYLRFKNMKPRKYISSTQYEYNINIHDKIQFHLECAPKYSAETDKCAVFLFVDEFPNNIEAVQIEYELICHKKRKYRHLMMPRWLSRNCNYCGTTTFTAKCLDQNTSISWIVGMKILDVQYTINNQKNTNIHNRTYNNQFIECNALDIMPMPSILPSNAAISVPTDNKNTNSSSSNKSSQSSNNESSQNNNHSNNNNNKNDNENSGGHAAGNGGNGGGRKGTDDNDENYNGKNKKKRKKKNSNEEDEQKFNIRISLLSTTEPLFKYRAKGIISISRKFTEETIPNRIVENIENHFSYIDKSTAINYSDTLNNETMRIFNYDIHDANTKEKLYCVATQNEENNRRFEFQMENKLFTKHELESIYNVAFKLPIPSSRLKPQFQLQLQQIHQFQQTITNNINTIIQKTRWHNVSIFAENCNKQRMTFSMRKQDFQRNMKRFVVKNNYFKLIPIVMFKNDKGEVNEHWIEYLWIIEIEARDNNSINIGISFNNNCEKKDIYVTGIHLNKQYILNQHQLALPQHDCKCLDNFVSIIDHLHIGNPDDDKNRVNDLKARNKKQKEKIASLELENQKFQTHQNTIMEKLKKQQDEIDQLKQFQTHQNVIMQHLKKQQDEIDQLRQLNKTLKSNQTSLIPSIQMQLSNNTSLTSEIKTASPISTSLPQQPISTYSIASIPSSISAIQSPQHLLMHTQFNMPQNIMSSIFQPHLANNNFEQFPFNGINSTQKNNNQ